MAKSMELTSDDLMVQPIKNASATPQRGDAESRAGKPTASAELIPMQFRMPPDFAKAFRVEAAARGMKYNELLKECFAAFMNAAK